jgi:hypothetical protein
MRPGTPCSFRPWLLTALLLVPFLQAGCQSMNQPSHAAETATAHPHREWSWPLRFKAHDFSVYCYDTYGCKVKYAGRLQNDDDPDELQPSSASYGSDYRHSWGGGQLGIANFPPPAEAWWKSKDGQSHHAFVDIGAIFHDRLIRHHLQEQEIPDDAVIMDPDIILEVNDHTLNVYMLASLPTKIEQIPGNRYSKWRRDMILVDSQRY